MSQIRDQYPQVLVNRQVLDSQIRILKFELLVQIRVQHSILGKPVGTDLGNSRVHSCNALFLGISYKSFEKTKLLLALL
jgi:hypothetical protein